MSAAALYMSLEEYLKFSETAEFRYEFDHGKVTLCGGPQAMAGGTKNHSSAKSDLLIGVGLAAREKGCEYFDSDFRVRTDEKKYVYPDASVVCGKPVVEDNDQTLCNPLTIFEVLSPSTEKEDRTTKFDKYEASESIREYVLVSTDQPRVEVYSRSESGKPFERHVVLGTDSVAELPISGLAIPLSEVFRRVEFEADEAGGSDAGGSDTSQTEDTAQSA